MQQPNSIDYDQAMETAGGKLGFLSMVIKKETAFIFGLKLNF